MENSYFLAKRSKLDFIVFCNTFYAVVKRITEEVPQSKSETYSDLLETVRIIVLTVNSSERIKLETAKEIKLFFLAQIDKL